MNKDKIIISQISYLSVLLQATLQRYKGCISLITDLNVT